MRTVWLRRARDGGSED
jgi:hypothetical protein